MDTQSVAKFGGNRAYQGRKSLFATDQNCARIGMTAQESQRSRDGHDRAVIATHAVDCNGDTHRQLA